MGRADRRWVRLGVAWLVVGLLLVGCGAQVIPTFQPEVSLIVDGEVAAGGTWDAERLQKLEIVGLVAIQPNGEEVTYQGVLLKDLLDAVEPSLAATHLVFTSADDDLVEMPLHQARACEECLVAFGPWGSDLRLAMPGQPAELWVNNLVSIEVQ